MNIEQARFNMIEQQVRPWKVFNERLLSVMATTPRELFVPEHAGLAYADVQLDIGLKQVMLAPRQIARMIQALDPAPQDKVLDIGTGRGYSSAILSKLARRVYTVDIHEEFVTSATNTHKLLGLTNIVVEEGDANDGWMAHAPYKGILITSAMPTLHENLKRNLAKNGRIVSILEQNTGYEVTLSTLGSDNEWQHESLFPIEARPLVNSSKRNAFEF